MISRLSLAAGAALLAAPAFAGGFAPTASSPAPVAPVAVIAPAAVTPASTGSDWSGFYVGGQFGFGNLSIDDNVSATDDEDFDGAVYGIHAGYMYDFGRVVVGGEIDWDATNINVDAAGSPDGVDLDSVARAKLRLGYDAGRALPYLTAGYARAMVSSDDDAIDAALDDSYDGHFYGIGIDYAVSDRISVGAEVLRHNFDDAPFDGIDTDVTTATLRASYRF
ncbi:putative outer membrane protein [Rubellimicrobium mesophilum DSM 19309]|uniref:Putative outer membrane protein n=1 Tax=Rubellimicrobium mesophilum DSM 19309 TaxID=442562 RepID=A0A017HQZ4_9RHOB|nr:outer membrane beta-barrel protein [Rubellimicrobium mesophilum]EYD76750.1 putative outer membrane protein [Rubellimicrobium mesophilum DSM 19309]